MNLILAIIWFASCFYCYKVGVMRGSGKLDMTIEEFKHGNPTV